MPGSANVPTIGETLEARMQDAADPELATLGAVIGALTGLPSDEARQRVIDFATARFNLRPAPKPKHDRTHGTAAEFDSEEEVSDGDGKELYAKFDHKKPSDNVALIVAKHYSRYGTNPFTVAGIEAEAASAGLTVPGRIDMTLNSGGKKGKLHYQRVGKGTYKVTVHGEAFLKATYQVKKGKNKPSVVAED